MKSNLKKAIGSVLFIVLLVVVSCNTDEITNINSEQMTAKEWFNSTFKNSAEWNQNIDSENQTTYWDDLKYQKDGDFEIFEYPLVEKKSTVEVISNKSISAGQTMRILKSTITRLVILKDDKGEMTVRKLYYVPDYEYLSSKGYDISDVFYGKEGDDFTGLLITKNWNDEILGYHEIVNGKIEYTLEENLTNDTTNTIQLTSYHGRIENTRKGEYGIGSDGGLIIYTPGTSSNGNYYPVVTVPSGSGYPPYDPYSLSGGGSSSSGGTTTNPNIYEVMIDPTLKNHPCLYNIYMRLGNVYTFQNYLQKFDSKFSPLDLRISIDANFKTNYKDNLGAQAITTIPTNKTINIIFNNDPNLPSKITNFPAISIATNFIHEMIHAEINRQLSSASADTNINPQKMSDLNWKAYVNNIKNDFPQMFEYYSKYVLKTTKPTNFQHQYIADKYRNVIKEALKQYDNNAHNEDYYDALSWNGLKKTTAWDNLTDVQRAKINKTIQTIYKNDTYCK